MALPSRHPRFSCRVYHASGSEFRNSVRKVVSRVSRLQPVKDKNNEIEKTFDCVFLLFDFLGFITRRG